MAKKNKNLSADQFGAAASERPLEEKRDFLYFGRDNYRWMLIGLGLITLGFLLMMGRDANTRPDGTFDPNYWNQDIFSVVRIRIAPLLVVLGFAAEVYAILFKTKK